MSDRTYIPYQEWDAPSKQTEYTEPTRLLDYDGTLLAKGWARHNVFDYDRTCSNPKMRKKEWDFYQLGNENFMVQISFANISIGGYVSAVLVDLKKGEKIALFGKATIEYIRHSTFPRWRKQIYPSPQG